MDALSAAEPANSANSDVFTDVAAIDAMAAADANAALSKSVMEAVNASLRANSVTAAAAVVIDDGANASNEAAPATATATWPADIQVVGKDIIKFHAIYWPAFLLAAGLPLPRRIVAHSHWTNGGVKMSKSLGNVLSPADIAHDFHGDTDAVRYGLLRHGPLRTDASYDLAALHGDVDADLADALGNLALRAVAPALLPGGALPDPLARHRPYAPADTATTDAVPLPVPAPLDLLLFAAHPQQHAHGHGHGHGHSGHSDAAAAAAAAESAAVAAAAAEAEVGTSVQYDALPASVLASSAWFTPETGLAAVGCDAATVRLIGEINTLVAGVAHELDRGNTEGALLRIAAVTRGCNVLISDWKPWELKARPEARAQLDWYLYCAIETVRVAALCLQPFTPAIAARLLTGLGVKPEHRNPVRFGRFGYRPDAAPASVKLAFAEKPFEKLAARKREGELSPAEVKAAQHAAKKARKEEEKKEKQDKKDAGAQQQQGEMKN